MVYAVVWCCCPSSCTIQTNRVVVVDPTCHRCRVVGFVVVVVAAVVAVAAVVVAVVAAVVVAVAAAAAVVVVVVVVVVVAVDGGSWRPCYQTWTKSLNRDSGRTMTWS